jgi:hypothetical protein
LRIQFVPQAKLDGRSRASASALFGGLWINDHGERWFRYARGNQFPHQSGAVTGRSAPCGIRRVEEQDRTAAYPPSALDGFNHRTRFHIEFAAGAPEFRG